MSAGTRLRLSVIDGAELRCAWCGEWWGLTPEFWRHGNFTRCIACTNERSRLYQAIKRRDPTFRAFEVDKTRRYRLWLRKAAPGLLQAYDRERRAQRRAWLIAYRAQSEPEQFGCLCGLTIHAASKADVQRSVRRHNATARHKRWRYQQRLAETLLEEQVA